ncbi:hypothetical protein RvY_04533 [Ramazzottius varieornatus]|uniref:CNNM transmembrane domain-containing protein n=1 Tax=Ramazzottius varieornatus TaxID=947166 RepID=A0A1D1UVH6_RAMVA|nr:hypothetical protein RvY_04533 [Ramazzottius varieornatus]
MASTAQVLLKRKFHATNSFRSGRRVTFCYAYLVIGSVLVNTSLTTLLDDLTSGLSYAVIFCTTVTVLFGEIVPQALCNRFGLAIGSATRCITMV